MLFQNVFFRALRHIFYIIYCFLFNTLFIKHKHSQTTPYRGICNNIQKYDLFLIRITRKMQNSACFYRFLTNVSKPVTNFHKSLISVPKKLRVHFNCLFSLSGIFPYMNLCTVPWFRVFSRSSQQSFRRFFLIFVPAGYLQRSILREIHPEGCGFQKCRDFVV